MDKPSRFIQVGASSALCACVFFLILTLNRHLMGVEAYTSQRNLYLLALLMVLPLGAASDALLIRFFSAGKKERAQRFLTFFLATGLVIGLGCYTKAHKEIRSVAHAWLYVLAGLAIGLALCGKINSRWLKRSAYWLAGTALIFELGVLTFNHTWGFAVRPGFFGDWKAQLDFNAVFYSVVQAMMGELPLVDYEAQYGHYALFLGPLFRLFPHSIGWLVGIVTLLTLVAFIALMLGIRNTVKHPLLRLALGSAVLFNLYFIHKQCYWANLPIRFFFPSVVFFGLTQYLRNRRKAWYWATSLACALAVVWNLDSGIPVLLAWLFTLSYQDAIASSSLRAALKPIARHWLNLLALESALVLLISATYYLLHQSAPPFAQLMNFPSLYFTQGYNSLVIHPFDHWVLLAFCYIAGFSYCWRTYRDRSSESPAEAPTILFLTFLGCGIFSYYIMRSHVNCLLAVGWPALVLTALFADNVLAVKSDDSRLIHSLWGIPLAAFFSYLWINALAGAVTTVPRDWSTDAIDKVEAQRNWVKNHLPHGEPIIVFSDKSSVFQMDLMSPAPLLLPSASELALPVDIKSIEEYLGGSLPFPRRVLLDDAWYLIKLPKFEKMLKLLSLMKERETSPDGQLHYFAD